MKTATWSSDRLVWTFWTGAALAAVGGVAPIVLSAGSGRLNAALIPFWVAAAALAGSALTSRQGRTLSSIFYFIGGVAVVLGLLALFSVSLRLALLGSCPAAPAACPAGLEPQLSGAEVTGIWAAVVLGVVALMIGFFGLVAVYRRSVIPPSPPPARRIPPVSSARAPAPQPEPARAEEPELPAHEVEELPELPAHSASQSST